MESSSLQFGLTDEVMLPKAKTPLTPRIKPSLPADSVHFSGRFAAFKPNKIKDSVIPKERRIISAFMLQDALPFIVNLPVLIPVAGLFVAPFTILASMGLERMGEKRVEKLIAEGVLDKNTGVMSRYLATKKAFVGIDGREVAGKKKKMKNVQAHNIRNNWNRFIFELFNTQKMPQEDTLKQIHVLKDGTVRLLSNTSKPEVLDPKDLKSISNRLFIKRNGKLDKAVKYYADVQRTTSQSRWVRMLASPFNKIGSKLPKALAVVKWPMLSVGFGVQAIVYGVSRRPQLLRKLV